MDAQALGRYLRDSREARELTLEDVESALKIRRRILESFETGQFELLELSTVQVRGFVRNYARYLGLDEAKVVGYYEATQVVSSPVRQPRRKDRDNRKNDKRSSQEAPVAAKSITDTDPTLPTVPEVVLTMGDAFEQRRRRRLNALNRTVIFLVAIAALSVIVLIGYQIIQRPLRAIEIEDLPDIIDLSTLTPTFTPLPTSTSFQQAIQPTSLIPLTQVYTGQGIMVSVLVKQRTWIRVVADGEERFIGTVPPNSELPLIEALQRVELSASNADALLVTYNGVPQRSFGQRGQRVDVIFTQDQMDVSSGITFDPTSEFTATFVPTSEIDVGALIEAQTPTRTPGPSPTPTLTFTPSLTPTETPIPSDTPTLTPTIGPSPTPTATFTLTPTFTPSPTLTPSDTPVPSLTPTPTAVLPLRETQENLTPTKIIGE